MSIQGFLSDRSLINKTNTFVNLETLNLPCGFLDRDTIEFFNQPIELGDLRQSRLAIQYREEVVSEIDDVFFASDMLTSIYTQGITHLTLYPSETVTLAQYTALDFLEFINDVLPSGYVSISNTRELKFTTDYVKVTGDDLLALNSMNALEQQRIFNVMEYLAYGTISSDTISDINSELVNNPTEYLGYVANSISFSNDRSVVYIYGDINIHRLAPQYFTFKFIVGNYTIQFKVWFNKAVFKTAYPESTIINIIPPFDLNVLLNPSSLSDPINSAILSKKWSDALMKPEIGDHDQTGMYLFETRYIYNGTTYQTVFSLIYRGREPDSLEARNHISEYLLNSGVGTRALWELLLPDIFYDSSFALIPIFGNSKRLTNSDIYPSIIDASSILEQINTVAGLLPRAPESRRELMTSAYDKYFIGITPSDINEQESLLAIHPTYRDFTTTDTGYAEMTADTREWSVKLNQALAVASGESNLLSFAIVESGGLNFVNFVYKQVNYLVLTKASYFELFPVTE